MMITMWIAVITFIGAGAVDWGGASYGNKASAVAVVGEVPITAKELNKRYSQLFRQFNQQMGGKFDEKMAEQFGLQDQALNQLISQALLLNLAKAYELKLSDEEIIAQIEKIDSFHKDGKFDIETYKRLLKSNGYDNHEFEKAIGSEQTIAKLSDLLTSKLVRAEKEAFLTMQAVADKISYTVLDSAAIKVDVKEEDLKQFWELQKNEYQTEAKITVEMITKTPLNENQSEEKIQEYYNKNSFNFTNDKGEVMTLEEAKPAVIEALNDKATKNAANRLYIAWKKGELPKEITVDTKTFTTSQAPFSLEIMEKIAKLKPGQTPLKAQKLGDDYVVIRLKDRVDPRVKSYEEAKALVLPKYIASQKRLKLQELATQKQDTFKGSTTGFITIKNDATLKGLSKSESQQALAKLFTSSHKKGIIAVSDEKVLLYDIKEQKLLFKENSAKTDLELDQSIAGLKERARFIALMRALDTAYPTENYLK